MNKYIILLLVSTIFSGHDLISQRTDTYNQPKELGKVSWYRNYNEAIKISKQLNKPVFILFQEVPGCATCQNYGQNVLSHPLIVDAIENEFIPLAIYNNVEGHDREILTKYNEPTWNNPVIRIVDNKGQDIIERHNGNYSQIGLANYMLVALGSGFYGQPGYLQNYAYELEINSQNVTSEATFSMYCFWSGEAHLGNLEGVVETSPGFMNGKEVVQVKYDHNKIDISKLEAFAAKENCQIEKSNSKFRIDKDPQYYLKNTKYKYLALTPMQKTKINSALKNNQNTMIFLSPSQKNYLRLIENGQIKHPKSLYEHNFLESWSFMIKALQHP